MRKSTKLAAMTAFFLGATCFYYSSNTVSVEAGISFAIDNTEVSELDSEQPEVAMADVTTISTADGVNVIKWKSVDMADGYIIMRKSLKSEKWTEIAKIEDSSAVRYEDADISADLRYYYTVRAYATDETTGDIIYADYENDDTGVIASVGTVVLNTLTSEGGKNTITWEPIKGVQGYVIKRRNSAGTGWITVAVVKGADRDTYTDSKAIYAGTDYTYTIFAMGKKQNGERNYGGFDKEGISTCASVKKVTMKAPYSVEGRITVKWNKVNGAAGYEIYRKADNESEWTLITTAEADKVKYNDTDVSAGEAYTYKVRAFYTTDDNNNVYGEESDVSNSVVASVATVELTEISSGYIKNTLGWNEVKGAEGYIVYRKLKNSSKWTRLDVVTDVTDNTYTYTDTTCEYGKTYTYTVKAYIKSGDKTVYGKYDKKGVSVKTVDFPYPLETLIDMGDGEWRMYTTNRGLQAGNELEVLCDQLRVDGYYTTCGTVRLGEFKEGNVKYVYVKITGYRYE